MPAAQTAQTRCETEPDLLAWLAARRIPYTRLAHAPVFTCEEAERERPDGGAVSTKNLFLTDRHSRQFYLLMTACEKRLDLKALGAQMGLSKLHFGDESRLFDLLGVTRGAVTVLGLVNDAGQHVRLWLDAEIWQTAPPERLYLCHPLVNTASLLITKGGLERFFAFTGHSPFIVAAAAGSAPPAG